MKQLIVHSAAWRELDAALEWSKANFGSPTGTRLQRRFEQAGEMLMREPALGTPAVGQARKLALSRFRFTLVYRVEGDVIHVLALMHQSGEPRGIGPGERRRRQAGLRMASRLRASRFRSPRERHTAPLVRLLDGR